MKRACYSSPNVIQFNQVYKILANMAPITLIINFNFIFFLKIKYNFHNLVLALFIILILTLFYIRTNKFLALSNTWVVLCKLWPKFHMQKCAAVNIGLPPLELIQIRNIIWKVSCTRFAWEADLILKQLPGKNSALNQTLI